jgi:hypothetical protein
MGSVVRKIAVAIIVVLMAIPLLAQEEGIGINRRSSIIPDSERRLFFTAKTSRAIGHSTFAITATGSSTSYADFEALADQQAFSLRAYGSAFNTFMHAGVDLHDMAEFWSDQLVSGTNRGLLIGTGFGVTGGPPVIFATSNTVRMRLTGDGRVSIGEPADNTAYMLNVNGAINASGAITGATVINATFQDVAEWVPASPDALEPGTVVVLNPENGSRVIPSAEAYDTTVAGVVSAHPGIVLGKPGDGKAQVATTGRVKVKVDANKSAIRVGDLLVTSDVAGTAMRSEPMVVNGRRFHQPGTIIGKALEPLASGTGEVLVLLSLQ